jgi:hypothetical protein
MDLVFAHHENCEGSLRASRASVDRGRVTSATPAFAWAIGQGVHVLLSHCATRKIKWQKRRSSPQAELAL